MDLTLFLLCRILKRNVYFILDEFGNLPHFEEMDGMVTVARSRGVRFLFVLQSYSQLKNRYGNEIADIIKSNCNVKIFIGTDDIETRKEFSDLCGQKKIKTLSINTSVESLPSSNVGAMNQPLITTGMLERLNGNKKGDAIISVRGYQPIWSQFTPSYELKEFYFSEGKADLTKKEGTLFEKENYVFDINQKNNFIDERMLDEIDKEEKRLRLVYRVTGEKTGTKQFSELKAGDFVPVIGPLGNGFPYEKAEGKKVFLMGGGIGVPPILELAKQIQCEEKQIVVGYRDAHTFLKEEFEQNGTLYISTEDGSVGTKGNVMDAIREQSLDADIIFACGPTPMLRAIKAYAEEKKIECYISLEERMACGIGACLACVCKTKEKDAHSNVNNKRICKDGPVFLSTEVDL